MKIYLLSFILMCNFLSPPLYASDASLPPGNYVNSCIDCSYDKRSLQCKCYYGQTEDRSGKDRNLKEAAYRVPDDCNFIENTEGTLECTRWKPNSPYYNPNLPDIIDIKAGPIWDQGDAKLKCPTICAEKNSKWNGKWQTTEWNISSVCQCESFIKRFN